MGRHCRSQQVRDNSHRSPAQLGRAAWPEPHAGLSGSLFSDRGLQVRQAPEEAMSAVSAEFSHASTRDKEGPQHPPAADFGPNEWLVDELYQRYQNDPGSVDRAWWNFFADYETHSTTAAKPTASPPAGPPPSLPASGATTPTTTQ